ncbi:MAG: 50S ribosomal protein L25 [Acidobacteria bacterium]|nr:50S ribosomal protein L25 [Acidobacteriota bacterium]
MIKDITVEAEPREDRGKNAARRLRRLGRIPAVVYGEGKDAVPVSVSAKQIGQILHSATGHNTIFQLATGDGTRQAAMLVDWQSDPVSSGLLHADLKRVDLTRKIRVLVPIRTQGDAKGVKTQDGLLEVVTREVEIECLPSDIPEHIDADVTELLLGQAIRVKDLPASDRYRLTTDPERVLVHVVALRHEEVKPAEAAVEGVAEAAPAEPEVIKKGKQIEEGEAAEAKPAKEPKETKGKK